LLRPHGESRRPQRRHLRRRSTVARWPAMPATPTPPPTHRLGSRGRSAGGWRPALCCPATTH